MSNINADKFLNSLDSVPEKMVVVTTISLNSGPDKIQSTNIVSHDLSKHLYACRTLFDDADVMQVRVTTPGGTLIWDSKVERRQMVGLYGSKPKEFKQDQMARLRDADFSEHEIRWAAAQPHQIPLEVASKPTKQMQFAAEGKPLVEPMDPQQIYKCDSGCMDQLVVYPGEIEPGQLPVIAFVCEGMTGQSDNKASALLTHDDVRRLRDQLNQFLGE